MRNEWPRVVAIMVAASLAFAGCTWVPIKKEAAGIRVLRLGEDASACQRLGEIAVSVKSGIGSWQRNPVEVRDELETLARNEALGLRADSVQPLAEPDGGRQHWLAYRCGVQTTQQGHTGPREPMQPSLPHSEWGPILTGHVGDPEPLLAFVAKVEPIYPKEEECEGVEGVVLLQIVVGQDGRPMNVIIERSSHIRRLDGAAMDAAKQWRFEPPSRGGKASQATVSVPVKFGQPGRCSVRKDSDIVVPMSH